MKYSISKEIEDKLGDVVELWAEEVLPGRPSILGVAMFENLKTLLINKTEEIEKTFPL